MNTLIFREINEMIRNIYQRKDGLLWTMSQENGSINRFSVKDKDFVSGKTAEYQAKK